LIQSELNEAEGKSRRTGKPARRFKIQKNNALNTWGGRVRDRSHGYCCRPDAAARSRLRRHREPESDAGGQAVLNDELLTELLGEPLTYYERDDVNRLARANPTMMRTGRDGYACSGSPPGGPTCASTSRVPPFDEYRFWNRPYQ
jgi:hypothetical protein